MGNLSNFESNEIGQARMESLRDAGDKCKSIVNMIYAVAVEYENFRDSLDPVEDAEDIAYSDQSLDYMCNELRPILEGLTDAQKARVNQVIASLGIPLTV
jgi:hypothetical protein|tara:strand:- start:2073 stop:2372 length:300 start_codon:yes stop_codon:yes gene_type:complete